MGRNLLTPSIVSLLICLFAQGSIYANGSFIAGEINNQMLSNVATNETLPLTDEGMWMIQDINAALEKNMKNRGLKLSANEIYNADAEGATLSDAIISLGFYCTGSLISKDGLMITNHHCAYGDIHSISTPEKNYLEDGFWAMKAEEEIPIPNKEVFFLKKVLDVTSEVETIKENACKKGHKVSFRKLSWELEKKYKEETGLESSLASMWSGEKYYMALYESYKDLRLVAAPPVCIASFGGDIDNWEWPQHKCDFAMYRIYATPKGEPAEYSKENVPLTGKKYLKISKQGYKEGDFTMVIGYPGRTDRYAPACKIKFMEDVTLPITNKVRKENLDIINYWMNEDPEIRLKYSNKYFNLSNRQGLDEDKLACFKRFNTLGYKKRQEKELAEWIAADSTRKKEYGDVLPRLNNLYEKIRFTDRNKTYYKETLVIGSGAGVMLTRMNNCRQEGGCKRILQRDWQKLDPRVEEALAKHAITQFYENVDSMFYGPYQKSLLKKFGNNYDEIAEYVWDNSLLSSIYSVKCFKGYGELKDDSMAKFLRDINIRSFNQYENNLKENIEITHLQKKYTHAMYEMRKCKGLAQYPNANSTMRISYGQVSALSPRDGILCGWHSNSTGIIEKYDPKIYEYNLNNRALKLIPEYKSNVDFLTNNDITGGNSGSPVLNSNGSLIGLAFDGNRESLASDCHYTQGYNKCVCVDIRYILFILDKYAGMQRILDEIELD